MAAQTEESPRRQLLRSTSPESGGDAKPLGELWRENPSAFDAFYDTYFPRVYRYFQRRGGGVAETEEATESALRAIFEGVCRGGDQQPLEHWIFRQVREVARLSDRSSQGADLLRVRKIPVPHRKSSGLE